MDLTKIGKRHQEKGYYGKVNKEGKDGKAIKYRGIFCVWDAETGEWMPTYATKVKDIGTLREDAENWLDDKIRDFNKRGKTATVASKKGKTNFIVFAERYKQFLKENIKGWKQEWQKVDVLVEFFGNDDLKDIDFDRIEDFKRWLSKQSYTRQDGGKAFDRDISTIHRYLARLRHMLRNGSDRYQTLVPTFGHFIKKADETPKKTVITFDEFKRMLKACDDLFPRKPQNRNGWKLALLAAYCLGCRVNEIFEIRQSDIARLDTENRVGVIALKGEDTRTKKHKKMVDIPTVLYDAMEAAGCFEKDADERLFMWTKYYRNPFAKIKEKAGINPDANFKSLRASNATARDAAGQEWTAIKATMGHVPLSDTTEKHYVDRAAETVIEKAKPYSDYLDNLNWSDDDVLNADTLTN